MRLKDLCGNLALYNHLVVPDQVGPVIADYRSMKSDREHAFGFSPDSALGECDEHGTVIDQLGKPVPELIVHVEERTDDLTGECAVQQFQVSASGSLHVPRISTSYPRIFVVWKPNPSSSHCENAQTSAAPAATPPAAPSMDRCASPAAPARAWRQPPRPRAPRSPTR